jgi:hypothetical protein
VASAEILATREPVRRDEEVRVQEDSRGKK